MEEEVQQQPQEQQPEQPAEPRRHKNRWAGDYLEVLRQERVIRQYGRDIEELDRKLDQLTSDRDSLEKFAREEYYFHRENEEVFIVD